MGLVCGIVNMRVCEGDFSENWLYDAIETPDNGYLACGVVYPMPLIRVHKMDGSLRLIAWAVRVQVIAGWE